MAIDIATLFPTKTTGPSAAYPYGSYLDETSPGNNDGTPFVKSIANDVIGFHQALLNSLGIVPSGSADTALVSQYLQGVVQYAAGKATYYDETGAANAYVMDPVSDQYVPDAYFAGMKASFDPGIINTGASTGNINGIGVLAIEKSDGIGGTIPLIAGDIVPGRTARVEHDGTLLVLLNPAIPIAIPYILIVDAKAQNTDGGTATSGSWETRDLNQEVSDDGNFASLAANQITLQPGDYRCRILVPGHEVSAHQAKLRNITAGADISVGTSMYASSTSDTTNCSVISSRFTLAVVTVLEVQHQVGTTNANLGHGRASNFDTEVYTVAEFYKES